MELQNSALTGVMFASLAESSDDLIAIAALAGDLLYLNPAGRRLLECTPDEGATLGRLEDLFANDDLPYVREVILSDVERTSSWSGDARLRKAGGEELVEVALTAFYIRDEQGAPLALAAVGKEARAGRRLEERLRTLVDAGALLSHSIDYAHTFEALAQLMVRTTATLCMIDTFAEREDGTTAVQRVAAAHVDARWNLIELSQRFAPRSDEAPHPIARALFEGSSALIDVDDEFLRGAARSPEHLESLRALGVRSVVTVPLVAGGKILGALTCALGREDAPRATFPERYDAEDLFFIEELGRRAGAAIDYARSFERTRHIALVLQSASLPERLPELASLKLDADYRPSSNEVTIGGDWYDAFVLDDGRVVLTVGDVLGHGFEAAVAMTKLRQAMQSAAMASAEPNLMLDVADKTLRLHDSEGFATAIAAIFDPASATTTFASAGHPGPALRSPDGAVTEFSSPGMMLGLRAGQDRKTCVVPTPPGSVLVFFTDGLVEATRDLSDGYRRFHDALRKAEIALSPTPARALVDEALQETPARDDIAVLVVTALDARRVTA